MGSEQGNGVLQNRLTAIIEMLNAGYQAGANAKSQSACKGTAAEFPNACKGAERELLIGAFLSQVLPPTYRFGSGSVIDRFGQETGQLDIVIENFYTPSVPIPGCSGGPRLYLAEGVVAVIEVKSDISSQWKKLVDTWTAVNRLEPDFEDETQQGSLELDRKVPFFAVGFTGWERLKTIRRKREDQRFSGLLQVDPPLYSSGIGTTRDEKGFRALWAFLQDLHTVASTRFVSQTDLMAYLEPLSRQVHRR